MSSSKPSRKRSLAQSYGGKVTKTKASLCEPLFVADDPCPSTSTAALGSYGLGSNKAFNCRECIGMHLQGSPQCPVCSRELDLSSPIIPNFTVGIVVDSIRNKAKVAQILSTLQEDDNIHEDVCNELIKITMGLDTCAIDRVMEALHTVRQQKEVGSSRKKIRLLLEFIDDMISHREATIKKTKLELETLKRDKLMVEAQSGESSCSDDLRCLNYRRMDLKADPVLDHTGENVSAYGDGKPSDSYSRLKKHFVALEQSYFSKRGTTKQNMVNEKETVGPCIDDLKEFSQVLQGMSQYGSFRTIASLRSNISESSSNYSIVSSIEFDKDGEYFAVAGVTCKVKIYEFRAVVENPNILHYPLTQLQCTAKISNVSWNPYTKNMLASSDYDGTVQVWDTYLSKAVRRYQEHEKRCWTVQFNNVDPHLMASGSDDAKVKIWSLSCERSVATIDANVNVCCVYFSPNSRHHLVFGGLDRCVHLYDLRNTSKAVNIFQGHRKPISYVKYCTANEVVSAATDNHLRVWDVSTGNCIRILKGHVNEKNFVGLATDGNHIICGSENNQLYLYYKGLSDPLMQYDFGYGNSSQSPPPENDGALDFVSAVCWKKNSKIVLAANTQGTTRILQLV